MLIVFFTSDRSDQGVCIDCYRLDCPALLTALALRTAGLLARLLLILLTSILF